MASAAWVIPGFPLLAFLLIVFGARRWAAVSAWLTVGAVAVAFVLSTGVLVDVLSGARAEGAISWLPTSFRAGPPPSPVQPLSFSIGFLVDPLTAIMLVVVSSVSLVVQIYSVGYMHGDPGYSRYFAFMALFTMTMLGLVLANNLLILYIFWELVGLCSYLLIGHWHQRPEAAAAAKKAFIVTRFGDVGFLVGILFLFWHTGSLDLGTLSGMAAEGRLSDPALTVGILLVFCGAVGKSAQFPLHVWLPDAMEGPTPVSALIHAATMVAAGVYLMARTFPILEHSPLALSTVAAIGGFTAFFAATMGLVSTDIKRVLAYSTVSQLGYMFLGIGVGAMSAGIFHLFNHAFFKALLFLCAGSVIHLVHTNDLFRMGGLRQWRPTSYLAMTVAALSLAGLFPLSGFWSKDEILTATAAANQPILFLLATATVFLTAFYMFRVIFLTFTGAYRGQEALGEHPEPASMTIPLFLLLVPSIASGLLGAPPWGNALGAFLEGHPVPSQFRPEVAGISTIMALGGISLAWAMYGRGSATLAVILTNRARPIYRWLLDGYYLDRLYNWLAGGVVLGLGWLAARFDASIVDGAASGTGAAAISLGSSVRRLQSGQLQAYAWALFAGMLVLALTLVGLRIER